MLRLTSKFALLFCSAVVVCAGSLISQAHAGLTLYGTAFSGAPFDPNNNLSTLYQINQVGGAATAIGAIGDIGFKRVGAIDFDSDGTLYGVGQRVSDNANVLITINRATGVGTEIGALGFLPNVQDISFRNGDGTLYAYSSSDIYTINKISGLATHIGPTGEAEVGGALAFTAGDTLLKAGAGHLFTINQGTGAATSPLALTYPFNPVTSSRANAMDFDYQTGILWGSVAAGTSGSPANYLATIDTATGLVTKVGNTVIGLDGLAAIPEPSTYGVFAGLALVGIGMVNVARRRKATAI